MNSGGSMTIMSTKDYVGRHKDPCLVYLVLTASSDKVKPAMVIIDQHDSALEEIGVIL